MYELIFKHLIFLYSIIIMSEVLFSKSIDKILEKMDFSCLGKSVAIKLHFGEKGCDTYIKPELVKQVYDHVVAMGSKATLVDCNVLYRGSRTNSTDHIQTAKEHGFTFAPINILDGEDGSEYIEVSISNGLVKTVKLGKGLEKYDSMIVLTHFKGHLCGYGGAFKNIGMGLGSRAGKLQMHSNVNPSVNEDICTGCGVCQEHCNFNAISIKEGKARIDPKKCAGCAMCIAVCPQKAVQVPWNGSTNEELCKKIVDYSEGVMKTIGKNNMIFINVLQDITERCDCVNEKQQPMMKDVGILTSEDPVAIDQASLDMVNKESNGAFDKINECDNYIQVKYAEEKGLGSRKYKLTRC